MARSPARWPRTRLARSLGFCLTSLSAALLLLAQPARAADPARVEWKAEWPRFRTSEAILTGTMLLPIAGALLVYPQPKRNFEGGFLFDDAARDALVLDSRSGRERAATVSDNLYYGIGVFPLLVDTFVVTGLVHGAGDVALEMTAMNLQSYALTGAVALTFQKLGRVRPVERGCRGDPNYSSKCDNEVALNQSFVSGHTAIAMTSAGLTCAHHQHLPLYGGGFPDLAICIATIAGATTSGVLRVMSDNHYTSDVLLGMGLGFASGYVLPNWLHYGFGSGNEKKGDGLLPVFRGSAAGAPMVAVLAPQFDTSYAGLTVVGAY
jgi:membrane-associated phospholipid phosphatase